MIKKYLVTALISCMCISTVQAAPRSMSNPDIATNSNAIEEKSIATPANLSANDPSVFASLEDDADFYEICVLEGDIIEQANAMLRGYSDSIEITENDWDWADATKLYLQSSELFEDHPNMDIFYEETEYIWVLPIYIDDFTLEITFNKIRAVSDNAYALLSDEALEELEDSVGKWKVIGGRMLSGTCNYKIDIAQTMDSTGLSQNCHSFMLTGLIGISMPKNVLLSNVSDGN